MYTEEKMTISVNAHDGTALIGLCEIIARYPPWDGRAG